MKMRWWTFLVTTALVGACGGGADAQSCPSVAQLRAYKPPEASRVYASDGSRIADLSPERRVVVELTAVPKTVWGGFVAVEDKRFFQHSGVDYRGVARALMRDVM